MIGRLLGKWGNWVQLAYLHSLYGHDGLRWALFLETLFFFYSIEWDRKCLYLDSERRCEED